MLKGGRYPPFSPSGFGTPPQCLSNLGFTQQASVRRGPRASATYLLTVLLAESKASAFFPNGVCVSPIIVDFTIVRAVLSTLSSSLSRPLPSTNTRPPIYSVLLSCLDHNHHPQGMRRLLPDQVYHQMCC